MDFPHKEWYLQLWIYFMFFLTCLNNIDTTPNKGDLGNIHLDNLAFPFSQNTYRQLAFFPWNYGFFESPKWVWDCFCLSMRGNFWCHIIIGGPSFRKKILRFMSVSDKTKLIRPKHLFLIYHQSMYIPFVSLWCSHLEQVECIRFVLPSKISEVRSY